MSRRHDDRSGGDSTAGLAGAPRGGGPGKRTRTERLAPTKRPPPTTPAEPRRHDAELEQDGGEHSHGEQQSADGLPDRRDGSAGQPSAVAPGSFEALPPEMRSWMPEVEQVLAELDERIPRATWKAIRPTIVPITGAGAELRARQRRRGAAPDLTGVGSRTSIDEVVAGIRALQPGWPRMPGRERMQQILGVVNRALIGADVPPALDVQVSVRSSKASFNYKTWKLWLSAELVDKTDGVPPASDNAALDGRSADGKVLADADAADLASTTAHEARHAEQWFLAARFAAANGKDAAAIVAEQEIWKDVAVIAAVRKTEGLSPDALDLAESMHEATIENKKDNRAKGDDTGYLELEQARLEAVSARDGLRGAPSEETLRTARAALAALRGAIEAVVQKYVAYRNIPYEWDGHEVGTAAELAFEESSGSAR